MVLDGLEWLNDQWLSSLNSVLVGAGFKGLVYVFTPSCVVKEQGSRVRRKVSVLTPSYGIGFKGSEKSIHSYSKLRSRVQWFGEKYPFLLQTTEQGSMVWRIVSVLTPSYGVGFNGSEKSIRSYSKLWSRVQGFGEQYPFLLQAMEQGLRVQRIVSVLTPSYRVGFNGSENSIRSYSKLWSRV